VAITPDLAVAAIFGAADRTGCSISEEPVESVTPKRRLLNLSLEWWILGAAAALGACFIFSGNWKGANAALLLAAVAFFV
jgi:hypothetical protein